MFHLFEGGLLIQPLTKDTIAFLRKTISHFLFTHSLAKKHPPELSGGCSIEKIRLFYLTCSCNHLVVTLLGRSMGIPMARSQIVWLSIPMARLTENSTV